MYLWAGIEDLVSYDNQLLDMKKNYNIDHGICFVKVHENHTDIFDFATDNHRSDLINFYLNNIDLLNNFFLEYCMQFKDLLAWFALNAMEIPLRPKDFKRSIPGQLSSLTPREMECLSLIVQGNTAKMVARHLNVSYRTVERHIENSKEKLKVRYQAELISKYLDLKALRQTS
jgi:LuxR family transcriptional regulator, quorum-sensing system regulator SolR